MKTESYTLEIEVENKKQLEKVAEDNHRTLAGQLRYIIEKFLESPEANRKS